MNIQEPRFRFIESFQRLNQIHESESDSPNTNTDPNTFSYGDAETDPDSENNSGANSDSIADSGIDSSKTSELAGTDSNENFIFSHH